MATIDDILALALRHREAGRLAEAEAACREALAAAPDHPDALNLLGVLLVEQGRPDEALPAYRRTIELRPGHAELHSNLGNALLALGRFEDAAAAYRQAIELRPDLPEAHVNLGGALQALGKLDDAVAAFRRAIELRRDFPEAHFRLGSLRLVQGVFDEAIAAFREAAAARPTWPDAYNSLGRALQLGGRLSDAIAAYHRAVELRPDYPEAHCNLGYALQLDGRLGDSLAACLKALELRPAFAEAHNNLGVTLTRLGRSAEAAQHYQRAVAIKPDLAVAQSNLGSMLRRFNRFAAAMACLQRALALQPGNAEAHNNLGTVLVDLGRLDRAAVSYRRALGVKPDYAEAHSNLLWCLTHGPVDDPAALFAEHRDWGARHTAGIVDARPHGNDRNPDRRLRIGYVSPDLRQHAVAYFVEPLLAAHDRAAVEAICYANVGSPDAMTDRLRGLADGWCSIWGMSDAAAAARIRADRIDILVDVAGHTADNRLLVFARRPAPVQVTYLGYPNTTGMAQIDYRLTDRWVDPPGQEAVNSERLVRLDRCFACYAPPADAPPVAPPPSAAAPFAFGSLNRLSKITPEVVALWSRILLAAPESRLVLSARPFAEADARSYFLEQFERHGVAPARLDLVGGADWPAVLGLYGRVDLGLDPFPYNGHTTTCEALWMGVPVLTLAGRTAAGRVGISMLTAVGLADLIAETPDDYVARAVALARDPERTRRLRARLRDMTAGSPLCDARGFATAVEAAYREMWRRWLTQYPLS